ncbi:SCAN domain-containing protein 3 [Holothuria leucospilota]|uniref:SCAN domain-containing protein 3 n=1 Tax=Holothuria leucospilota TaxID=206669 RepID=A0A9Q0YIX1_HOLLE|nr:SCAN domain-containing protein 3 [Holothuria leucospilota]
MESEGSAPKKQKKWYRQAYKDEWQNDPDLKDWLVPDESSKYAVTCTICDCKLMQVNKTGLLAHKETKKHCRNLEAKKKSSNITDFFQSKSKIVMSDAKIKAATAELMLTGFMAEHSLPFSIADHLTEVCKSSFPDSQIAKDMKLKKTKASYLMQDGIARHERLTIQQICRTQMFSIIIDESTDVSVSQVLAVMVRYFDADKGSVADVLLDATEVNDASAAGLYKAVKTLLEENEIPMSNIIGFAADNCSTMMGKHSGFQALLKKEVPHAFIIGCVCHSFALCAHHASLNLPSWLEGFLKDVCNYFARSSKRQNDFRAIQDMLDQENHKMLKLSQTRWLSRGMVIDRILEQWDSLLVFFRAEATVDKTDGASRIYGTMVTPGTKHMLCFLKYTLAKVDAMNVEFQAEAFRLHKVFNVVSDEYRTLLNMFVDEHIMKSEKLAAIDPENPGTLKACENVYLGGRCEAMLLAQPLGKKEQCFRLDCLSFLKVLCREIRTRFPMSDESVMALLRALDVKGATSTTRKVTSIIPLAVKFPNIVLEKDLDDLQDQWFSLPSMLETVGPLAERFQEPPMFWRALLSVRDGNGELKFATLAKFMTALLALPPPQHV